MLPTALLRRAPLVLGLFFIASVSEALQAQGAGSITGVFYDSLRTGGPVANAEIVLLGASRRTITDTDGHFQFRDLPAGSYTVAYWGPWLDSLALPGVRSEVNVPQTGSVSTVLATPSAATYQRAVCGTVLDEEQGILIGEVRNLDGSPFEGVGISAVWTETIIGPGIFERQLVASADSTNASGMYSLCGVPVTSEFALRGYAPNGVNTGELLVSIGSVVGRRDILIGAPSAATLIRGRVLDPTGTPVTDAMVSIAGDSGQVVRTGEDGRFVMAGIPQRSAQLIARAVGFVPHFVDIEPFDTQIELDSIPMMRIPQELEAVMVGESRVTVEQLQFDTRRRRGLGSFIDDEQLKRLPIISANVVSSMIPRTTVVGRGSEYMLMFNRTSFSGGQMSNTCRPRFFIDGYAVSNISADEEAMYFRIAVRIEAYTAQYAPSEFVDFNGCGSIVIWTR